MSETMFRAVRTVEIYGPRELVERQVEYSLAPGFRWLDTVDSGQFGMYTSEWAKDKIEVVDVDTIAARHPAPIAAHLHERHPMPPGGGYNAEGALGDATDAKPQVDVVASILADLQDRCGFSGVWDSLDEDVKAEIESTWRGFAR